MIYMQEDSNKIIIVWKITARTITFETGQLENCTLSFKTMTGEEYLDFGGFRFVGFL